MASPPPPPRRPDLANATLKLWLLATALAIAAYFLAQPHLPRALHAPGSALLQSAAIAGALLLLVPFAFAAAKRSGGTPVPNRWLIAHVLAGLVGAVLVAVHTTGKLDRPPALLLAALAGLAVTGAAARLGLARHMAATLGSKAQAFAAPDPALRAALGALMARKAALLSILDPAASEATFSLRPRHWLRSPLGAAAYARLAAREAALTGARRSVPAAQAWWRPLHLALAWLYLAGLMIHVIVVTFFAGWAADGRAIYWWHVTAW